jgi:hypothetical protein
LQRAVDLTADEVGLREDEDVGELEHLNGPA